MWHQSPMLLAWRLHYHLPARAQTPPCTRQPTAVHLCSSGKRLVTAMPNATVSHEPSQPELVLKITQDPSSDPKVTAQDSFKPDPVLSRSSSNATPVYTLNTQ